VARSEARRTLLFAAALAALIGGAIGLALGGHGEGASGGGQSQAPPGKHLSERLPSPRRHRGRGKRGGGAENTVAAFLRAYLRYETGSQALVVRATLSRYATPPLAEELLGAPVRVPPGARMPKERLMRIAAERPSVVDGTGATRVCAIVLRDSRRARLCVGALDRGGRWAVAEVGP
jgi:hypothetical protein